MNQLSVHHIFVGEEKERVCFYYGPLAFGPVTSLGRRAKAPSVVKGDRGRSEVVWSLAVVQH